MSPRSRSDALPPGPPRLHGDGAPQDLPVTMVMGPPRANSVPVDGGNVTLKAAARSGVTPAVYTRDLALATAACFTGETSRRLACSLVHLLTDRLTCSLTG